MKKTRLLLTPIALILLCFTACKKESTQKEAQPASAAASSTPVNSAGLKSGSNWTGILLRSDGAYSGGDFVFSSIIAKTGSFVDGEPVAQIDISTLPPGAGNLQIEGPTFSFSLATLIGGADINFYNDFNKYRTAWGNALKGTGPTPLLSSYVKSTYGTGGTVNVISGVVVRSSNSSTTYAIAPADYKPLLPNHYGQDSIILGYVDKAPYTIYFNGYTVDGYVSSVDVYNGSTKLSVARINIEGNRQADGTGFHVAGDIHLTNSTYLIVDDDIDGF